MSAFRGGPVTDRLRRFSGVGAVWCGFCLCVTLLVGCATPTPVMSAHRHGEHLVLSNSTTVSIWDPDADRLVARFEGFKECIDAVSYGDDIIVSQYGTGSVLRFHPAAPDDRTTIATGLDEPAGLAVQGDDLYVADRSGTLFQILDDGDTVEPPRPVAGELAGPEGIAAAEDGTLYVVEEDAGRVTHVDPQTGTVTSVADGLALSGLERRALGDSTTIGSLSGVTVGNGALFVSDYQGNRVYRIDEDGSWPRLTPSTTLRSC